MKIGLLVLLFSMVSFAKEKNGNAASMSSIQHKIKLYSTYPLSDSTQIELEINFEKANPCINHLTGSGYILENILTKVNIDYDLMEVDTIKVFKAQDSKYYLRMASDAERNIFKKNFEAFRDGNLVNHTGPSFSNFLELRISDYKTAYDLEVLVNLFRKNCKG